MFFFVSFWIVPFAWCKSLKKESIKNSDQIFQFSNDEKWRQKADLINGKDLETEPFSTLTDETKKELFSIFDRLANTSFRKMLELLIKKELETGKRIDATSWNEIRFDSSVCWSKEGLVVIGPSSGKCLPIEVFIWNSGRDSP